MMPSQGNWAYGTRSDESTKLQTPFSQQFLIYAKRKLQNLWFGGRRHKCAIYDWLEIVYWWLRIPDRNSVLSTILIDNKISKSILFCLQITMYNIILWTQLGFKTLVYLSHIVLKLMHSNVSNNNTSSLWVYEWDPCTHILTQQRIIWTFELHFQPFSRC